METYSSKYGLMVIAYALAQSTEWSRLGSGVKFSLSCSLGLLSTDSCIRLFPLLTDDMQHA